MTKIPINVSLNKWLINILRFTLIIQEKVVSTLLLFYILKNKEKQTEINKHRCNRNQHHSPVCHGWVPTVLPVLPAASHNLLCTHQLLLQISHPTAQRQGYYSATHLHYLPKTPSLVHTSHKIPLHKILYTFKILLYKILFAKKLLNSIFILLTLSS